MKYSRIARLFQRGVVQSTEYKRKLYNSSFLIINSNNLDKPDFSLKSTNDDHFEIFYFKHPFVHEKSLVNLDIANTPLKTSYMENGQNKNRVNKQKVRNVKDIVMAYRGL